MAIIIPKSKIYNYNFNILQNNYIDRVFLNSKNSYNYQKLVINATTNNLGEWSANNWSSSIENATLSHNPNIASESINFTYSNINDGYKIYDPIILTLELPLETINTNNVIDLIDNINIEITYNNGDVEKSSAGFSYADNVVQFKKTLKAEKLGLFIFNSTFTTISNNHAYWYVYGMLLRRIEQDTGGSTLNLIKQVNNLTITINLKLYNENLNYNYTNVSSNYNNFELRNLGMLDKNVGFEDETSIGLIGTPIYEIISQNIVENWQNGKMTMKIETRYTTFEDDEGNKINDGNPYLIKVGDVVKPEMLDKFSAFEYEYVVTSVEYEYDGSDKVYLKLLQVNEE